MNTLVTSNNRTNKVCSVFVYICVHVYMHVFVCSCQVPVIPALGNQKQEDLLTSQPSLLDEVQASKEHCLKNKGG